MFDTGQTPWSTLCFNQHPNHRLVRTYVMPQRILLIQHDPAGARMVRDALVGSGDGSLEVDWVTGYAEGLGRLADVRGRQGPPKHRIAAVIVDLPMPESAGIEHFDRLLSAAPAIPFLVLSDSHNEAIARAAVRHGAQDYLLKTQLDHHLHPKTVHRMIDRAADAEASLDETNRAQMTLDSIGDAVVSTDASGNITFINPAAVGMTGWPRNEAAGRGLEDVVRLIDAATRRTVQSPIARAIAEDRTVGLTPNCRLIRRDGTEIDVDDSAAPIHDRLGRVTGAVMVFRDVTDARALALRNAHLAYHDVLTDLPNRSLFVDRMTQAMGMAQRRREKLALLYVDVDHFKTINDSMGHAVGDQVLQAFARRLRACVRGVDTVSRLGGDEFAILLPEATDARAAAVIAQKVLRALKAPHRIGQRLVRVTVSVGIAVFPDDAIDPEGLIQCADSAMYRAKAAGRDTHALFAPETDTHRTETAIGAG